MPRRFRQYPSNIKILVTRLNVMSERGIRSFPSKMQRGLYKINGVPVTFANPPMGKRAGEDWWPAVIDINTEYKLAKYIFDRRGDGTYVVSMINNEMRNKRYSRHHLCNFENCRFHPDYDGKRMPYPCKIYKRYVKGWSCPANKRKQKNWDKRARLSVWWDEHKGDISFTFHHSKMHFFKRWFWIGKEREMR